MNVRFFISNFINTILRTKTEILWHPESAGMSVPVKRTFIGRLTKSNHFATLNETLKHTKGKISFPLDYQKILTKILEQKEMLPLLIGLDNDLNKLITERLQK